MSPQVKAGLILGLIVAGAIIITTAMWIYYWQLDQAEGF
jgi:hypothetical protein